MRPLPSAFAAAMRNNVTNLCRLVSITRNDGFALHMTDATTSIVVDGVAYQADIGFSISGLFIGTNMNQTQGFALAVPISEGGVSKTDLRNRRYTGASIDVYECIYTNPSDRFHLYRGRIGKTSFLEVGLAQFTVGPEGSQLTTLANNVYSQTCRHSLGDDGCRYPIEQLRVNFTVTTVVSQSAFTVDNFGAVAESMPERSFYEQAQMMWTGGDNADWAMDIAASDAVTKLIRLMYAPPETINVGDTGFMYPGCNRYLTTCIRQFNNSVNFGGLPFATNWS